MKTHLLAFCGSFVLVGAIWAADTACHCPPTDGAATEGVVGRCGDACGTSACKVCVPEATKKKKDKVTYSSKCVDFCVPKPSCPHHACSGNGECSVCAAQAAACQACGGAGCIKCGRVRTKKVLIKKVQSIESDGYKCVPQSVCGAQGTCGPCQ